MTQDQIIAAITTALQTPDSNGEFGNVVLILQDMIINQLSLMSPQQLSNICTILSIDTSGGGS